MTKAKDINGDYNNYFYNDTRRRILEAIQRGKRQLVEIQYETGLSKPTIHKHIEELKAMGFITYEGAFNTKTGRRAGAELTVLGIHEYERLVKENWRVHNVKTPMQIHQPLYQEGSYASGCAYIASAGSVSWTEQEREKFVKMNLEHANRLKKEFGQIRTADLHFVILPDRVKKEKS